MSLVKLNADDDLRDLIAYCKDEASRVMSLINEGNEVDNPQYMHNGFAALQYFSMYMIATSFMRNNLEDVFLNIIKPFLIMETKEETELILTLKLEALALSVKHIQAFEMLMNPFVPVIVDFVLRTFLSFEEVYPKLNQDGSANSLSLYMEMISQSTHFCSFLYQINKNLLAQHAGSLIQPASTVFLSDIQPRYKYDLIEMIGHLLLLSTLTEKEHNEDDSDDEESDDENNFESTYLLESEKEPSEEAVYYWKVSSSDLPFKTILNITTHAIDMLNKDIEKDMKIMKSKDLSNIPMFLSTSCGATKLYYEDTQHKLIVEKSVTAVLERLPNSPYTQLIDLVRSLTQIVDASNETYIRELFIKIYTTLEDLFVSLKDWAGATPSRKNKKLYYKIREQIIKCLSTLITKDHVSTFEQRDHLEKAIDALFTDPQLLSAFIRSIYAHVVSNSDANKSILTSEMLPKAINKFFVALSKEKASNQVKTLIIRSISEIAKDLNEDFKPYHDKILELLTNLFHSNAYNLGVPILDSLSVMLPQYKYSHELPKVLVTVVRKVISIIKDDENIDDYDEDSAEYDNSGYLIYISEVFLHFVLKDKGLYRIIAKNVNLAKSIKHTLSNLVRKDDLLYDEEEALKEMAKKILDLFPKAKKK